MFRPIEVLLVEDNPDDVLLMRQVLAGEPFPMSVHVAVNGDQAIQILAAEQFMPDIVILDLSHPKLSGLSFLKRWHIDAPVVVFSSSSSLQDREWALELGAKEYVQKPRDLGQFARLMSQIVRNWAPRDAYAAVAG